MSMSIFSSFDAVCAEFFGQKVGFSSAQSPSNSNKQVPAVAASVKIDDLKKGKEVNSSSQPPNKPEVPRRKRTPRFAPELDGVHCFETILPY
ncbi:hypothetical protein CDL12_04353 [Handroanthus impetiginosus]|uniref:Uncharacterized protein n=1 Tax=Handroanthus impetiginosus TaxID=429701 RepID=A0A2G9HZI2_9LAMI|nr:hypothetical protein CDL12_04353 [Handroanthus impetiginosus]